MRGERFRDLTFVTVLLREQRRCSRRAGKTI
jgi:hypothetical protein